MPGVRVPPPEPLTSTRSFWSHLVHERGDLARAALGFLDVEHVPRTLEGNEAGATDPGEECVLLGARAPRIAFSPQDQCRGPDLCQLVRVVAFGSPPCVERAAPHVERDLRALVDQRVEDLRRD